MAGKKRIPPITYRAVPEKTPAEKAIERDMRDLLPRRSTAELLQAMKDKLPPRSRPKPRGGPPKAAAAMAAPTCKPVDAIAKAAKRRKR